MKNFNDTKASASAELLEEASDNTEASASTKTFEDVPFVEPSDTLLPCDDPALRVASIDPSMNNGPLRMHLWCLRIDESFQREVYRELVALDGSPWGKLSDATQRRRDCFKLALRVFPSGVNRYLHNDGRIILFILLDKLRLYEVYKFFVNFKEEFRAAFTYFMDETYQVLVNFMETIRSFFSRR